MEDQSTNKRTTRFTRNKTEDVSVLLNGKIPPQARELEEAVLGAILIEREALNDVAAILKPEMFYVDAHVTIYRACLEVDKKSISIDLLTLTEHLRSIGKLEEVGGAYYLSELTNKIASSANIEHHARIIAQKWMQREVISVSNNSIRDAYEDTTDVFDLIENNQKKINDIISNTVNKDFVHVGTNLARDLSVLETIRSSENKIVGIPCGIVPIDKFFRGWEPGDLIIIAARPSVGKTALAASIAHGAASLNIPVAIASLEMPERQMRLRLLSIESDVDLARISKAGYSDTEKDILYKCSDSLMSRPIYIDDQAGLSLTELRTKATRLKRLHGIKMLIVDYLQLMSSGEKGLHREQEISTISRGLKKLAKDLDIPVIALSQLNRSVESRGGEKRPQLSDLRESGAIEQDADIVIFPHRPDKFGIMEYDDGSSTKNTAILIVAKYRNGPTGDIAEHLAYDTRCAKFYYKHESFLNDFVEQKPTTQTDEDLPF